MSRSGDFHDVQNMLMAILCFGGLAGAILPDNSDKTAKRAENFLQFSLMPIALFSDRYLLIWAVSVIPEIGNILAWFGERFRLSMERFKLETVVLATVAVAALPFISLPIKGAKKFDFPLKSAAGNPLKSVAEFIRGKSLTGQIVHPISSGGFLAYFLKNKTGIDETEWLHSLETISSYRNMLDPNSQNWDKKIKTYNIQVFVAEYSINQVSAMLNKAPNFVPVYDDSKYAVFVRHDGPNYKAIPNAIPISNPASKIPTQAEARRMWEQDLKDGNYYRAEYKLRQYLFIYGGDEDARKQLEFIDHKIAGIEP